MRLQALHARQDIVGDQRSLNARNYIKGNGRRDNHRRGFIVRTALDHNHPFRAPHFLSVGHDKIFTFFVPHNRLPRTRYDRSEARADCARNQVEPRSFTVEWRVRAPRRGKAMSVRNISNTTSGLRLGSYAQDRFQKSGRSSA